LSQTFAPFPRLTLRKAANTMFELNFSSNAERLVAALLVLAMFAVAFV
jgi:hypothetical protein